MKCCRNCDKDCVSKVPIFKTLDGEQMLKIACKIEHKEFKKNEIIFNEEDKGSTLYFINEGQIKLYKFTRDGKEQILYILSNGDFFGELNLLKKSTYNFSAKALTDCKVCTLQENEFKEMIKENPSIAINLLEEVTERLTETEKLVQSLATNDVDARLAYLLLNFSERYGKNNGQNVEFTLPITREDMANFIGVTRETISRKLRRLEDDKLIKISGTKKITVLDKDLLKEYI